MTPERLLQTQIVRAINTAPLGAWAVPNVVVKKTRGAVVEVTGLGTGSPDVWVAIAPFGTQVWIEVKLPEVREASPGRRGRVVQRKTTTRTEQDDWHAQAKRFGVEVHVARSVDEALGVVLEARKHAQKIRQALLTLGEGAIQGIAKLITSPQLEVLPASPNTPTAKPLTGEELSSRWGFKPVYATGAERVR